MSARGAAGRCDERRGRVCEFDGCLVTERIVGFVFTICCCAIFFIGLCSCRKARRAGAPLRDQRVRCRGQHGAGRSCDRWRGGTVPGSGSHDVGHRWGEGRAGEGLCREGLPDSLRDPASADGEGWRGAVKGGGDQNWLCCGEGYEVCERCPDYWVTAVPGTGGGAQPEEPE